MILDGIRIEVRITPRPKMTLCITMANTKPMTQR